MNSTTCRFTGLSAPTVAVAGLSRPGKGTGGGLRLLVAAALLLIASALFAQPAASWPGVEWMESLHFGSCLVQTRVAPVMETILALEPEVFLFAGDNIYADSTDPERIRREYRRLGDRTDFRQLRRAATLLATWDDHDYGANDAGKAFPAREASERAFESFWGLPDDHPAANRPGIYHAVETDSPVGRVQIVLLDTRYFRSPLRWVRTPTKMRGPYAPDTDPEATLLGSEQWRWLREVFNRPARLRIVVSSIQFAAEHHGYECWANFPREQRRMLDLVAEQAPGSVLFLSGDRHFAELSRITIPNWGPLYDLTSSGLNRGYPHEEPTPNANRVGGYYLEENFGSLHIVAGESPRIELQVHAVDGGVVLRHDVPVPAE